MILKVQFTDVNGSDSEGFLISSFFHSDVKETYGFVAKSDGTFESVPQHKLKHKNTFI